jgi:hypothetical protein
MGKSRTIAMTGRPPVIIDEDDWPLISSARRTSRADATYEAIMRGEVDRMYLNVRRHADGRSLVYASTVAAHECWRQPAEGRDWRGGEIVEDESDVPEAVAMMAEAAGYENDMVMEVLERLPAERLD